MRSYRTRQTVGVAFWKDLMLIHCLHIYSFWLLKALWSYWVNIERRYSIWEVATGLVACTRLSSCVLWPRASFGPLLIDLPFKCSNLLFHELKDVFILFKFAYKLFLLLVRLCPQRPRIRDHWIRHFLRHQFIELMPNFWNLWSLRWTWLNLGKRFIFQIWMHIDSFGAPSVVGTMNLLSSCNWL